MSKPMTFEGRRYFDKTITFLLVLTLCLCSMMLASCAQHTEPETIAFDFIEALVNADFERAKSLTIEEQWDRIEEWMEERQPFKCQGGEWDTTGISGGGNYNTVDNEWNWSGVYQCTSQETPYCLRVNDILMKETGNGWKVYDWGKICEAFDYAYRCGEICDR